MPAKNNKCCCDICSGDCLNQGTLRIECTACYEVPDAWGVTGFYGGTSDGSPITESFSCCESILGQMVLLNGVDDPYECLWSSPAPTTCVEDGRYYQIHLRINDIAPGGVELTVEFYDGDIIQWTNTETWDCLCWNELHHDGSGDVGDYQYCAIPNTLCLRPYDFCCKERSSTLPRTLHATFFEHSNCACAAGLSSFPLGWDNDLNRWVGDSTFCGDAVHLEVWCESTPIQGITTFKFDLTFDPGCAADRLDTEFHTTECDPLELNWAFSPTGCCVNILAAVGLVVTE